MTKNGSRRRKYWEVPKTALSPIKGQAREKTQEKTCFLAYRQLATTKTFSSDTFKKALKLQKVAQLCCSGFILPPPPPFGPISKDALPRPLSPVTQKVKSPGGHLIVA